MQPKVHIILARQSQLAVAIRRGPSHRVCTVGWDRERDVFTVGQWFKGRIYERRCDLSPDGKWFLYFALNGKGWREAKGSWTAISMAPYMKALVLWAKGDAWCGGGLFIGSNSYWLNDGPLPDMMHERVRDDTRLVRDHTFPGVKLYNRECLGVYYNRLQRDGWRLVDESISNVCVFEKALPLGMKLRKMAIVDVSTVGRGCYYDTHELVSRHGNIIPLLEDAEWADYDGRRIMWVKQGILSAAEPAKEGVTDEQRLYNFNPMTYEEIKAPY